MTDRKSPGGGRVSLDDEGSTAGWNLVNEEGEVESVSSDDSSTMDFLIDRAALPANNLEEVRIVPIADYKNLVMVDIPIAKATPASRLVNLDSDEDIVHIVDDATDDNLDDWVTHEMERRRSSSSPKLPKRTQPASAALFTDDDASSECSAGSDQSSWTTESVHGIVTEAPEDVSPPVDDELPADYSQGYRSSSRAYTHQRNNDANKNLTILLFVALTVVSAVAFGHFRGTTVVTRHSHYGAAFEAATPESASNVLSDIQKDQFEILKQLQQLLNIQGELKQRITSLEDENKDLRLRLLESRKKCTRILHRSTGYSEPPVVALNISANDDQQYIVIEDAPDMETLPISNMPLPTENTEPIAKPLSLSAVIRAKQVAGTIRANFQPVTNEAVPLPPFSDEVQSMLSYNVLSGGTFDRFLRIPKEQVDFVMVEDVVVPSSKLLGRRPPGFGPVPPVHRAVTPLPAPAVSRNWAYSERSNDDFSRRGQDIAAVHQDVLRVRSQLLDEELGKENQNMPTATAAPSVRHRAEANQEHSRPKMRQTSAAALNYQQKVDEIKADIQREKQHIQKSRKFREGLAWSNSSERPDTELPKPVAVPQPEKVNSIRADIRRERERIELGRKVSRETTNAWKNASSRAGRKLRKENSRKTKCASTMPPCKNGQSENGYCFLRSNKYRKPETTGCKKSLFWKSLPSFFKKHFAETEKFHRIVKELGVDIVQSNVFRKVMEEIPKQFKASSEWLDCQWKWWHGYGQRRTGLASYDGCSGYLTSWQHKYASTKKWTKNDDHFREKHTARVNRKVDLQKEAAEVAQDMTDSNESNWFFRRASDRAEFHQKLITAGRRMGNLTSWFFQRAKDREQQRMRYLYDSEHADPDRRDHRHPLGVGIPSDPIYEFLKHRAAWRRSAQYDV